jgi:hypothetical protein
MLFNSFLLPDFEQGGEDEQTKTTTSHLYSSHQEGTASGQMEVKSPTTGLNWITKKDHRSPYPSVRKIERKLKNRRMR